MNMTYTQLPVYLEHLTKNSCSQDNPYSLDLFGLKKKKKENFGKVFTQLYNHYGEVNLTVYKQCFYSHWYRAQTHLTTPNKMTAQLSQLLIKFK